MDVMFILSLLEFPMETSGQIFALLSSLLLPTFPRNAKRKLALRMSLHVLPVLGALDSPKIWFIVRFGVWLFWYKVVSKLYD